MMLATYVFRPFLNSPPVWDYWLLLILPLLLGVAIVYKASKVESLSKLPVQALLLTIYIVLAMAGIAAAVSVINSLV
jgi:hypothetical protein